MFHIHAVYFQFRIKSKLKLALESIHTTRLSSLRHFSEVHTVSLREDDVHLTSLFQGSIRDEYGGQRERRPAEAYFEQQRGSQRVHGR